MAKSARETAMDMLARREHSGFELQRKLLSKGFDDDDISAALSGLSRDGLLNDERFTEAFVHSRMQRGSGPLKIAAELKQRGVDESVIQDYLDMRDQRWREQAVAVRAKRFGAVCPADFKEKARQARFLQQRGYSSEQIQHALNHTGEAG